MILDLNSLKNMFKETIGSFVYPVQTIVSGSISLYSSGSIVQPFYPFSTYMEKGGIYVCNIVGSPNYVTIDICTDKTISSNTLVLQTGWNTFSIKRETVSRRQHFLKIYGGVNASNDYYLGIGPSNSYFYGSLETGNVLAFTIGVREFVKELFPIAEPISLSSLPIVVLDFISRRSVVDKYLTGDMLIEDLQIGIEVYSRYPDEADRIVSGIERGLILCRKSLDNVEYLTPIDISPISFVSPEIFRRDVTFNVRLFVSRE